VCAQKSAVLAWLTTEKLKMNQHVPNKNADLMETEECTHYNMPLIHFKKHMV